MSTLTGFDLYLNHEANLKYANMANVNCIKQNIMTLYIQRYCTYDLFETIHYISHIIIIKKFSQIKILLPSSTKFTEVGTCKKVAELD